MANRYYVESPILADHAALVGAEAHHLLHVMRAKKGDEVILFDGGGDEFTAVVERLGRSDVELRIVARRSVNREPRRRLALAVALPKGDRQKWLVEKAVELGVAELVPLEVARGVAQPADSALDRLRRSVIEASKQCGRNRLMQISPGQSWADFLAAHATTSCRLIAHPSAANASKDDFTVPGDCTSLVAAIGPEGGFTDDEVALALSNGWHPLDLGRRILRIETAALAMAARLIAD